MSGSNFNTGPSYNIFLRHVRLELLFFFSLSLLDLLRTSLIYKVGPGLAGRGFLSNPPPHFRVYSLHSFFCALSSLFKTATPMGASPLLTTFFFGYALSRTTSRPLNRQPWFYRLFASFSPLLLRPFFLTLSTTMV